MKLYKIWDFCSRFVINDLLKIDFLLGLYLDIEKLRKLSMIK